MNSFSSSFPGTPRASHNRDVQRYNYDSEDSSDSSVSDSGFGDRGVSSVGCVREIGRVWIRNFSVWIE